MCQRQVVTKVSYQNGALAWLLCALIFIFGGVFGCCLIPFCCHSCQDVQHKCPQCKAGLGTYKRL
ncbi:Lipopolysaccharide-induced tumor necrosis factor-alpha factor [Fasciolopsis buskii]|uniref:Lipopolysaccharide-induced tumor necrosis factor-alpha factor n=1 Tax=Fasciolopsis buskii TaxID=27845 RepID=A0A8E0RLJ1_9TREM|nr:Lipopolysaccharide-induced tumor necrosis factor-alpha factor [Fasciolopsis buski]